MQKFIGTKIIHAEEGKAPKRSGDHPEGTDGYRVRYPDGYESWSPASAFEESYRPINGMSFGLAIDAMKNGSKVRLPNWSEEVFIELQVPTGLSKMTAPYFYVTSRFGAVPWIPTMIEMLSDEWVLIEDT